MRKMRKLLQICAIALVMTACSAREEPALPAPVQVDPTVPAAVEEQVVERTKITALFPRHSQNTESWFSEFEKKYEEENPEIDLVVTWVSWHDVDGAVRDCISSGNMPDLVNTDNFRQYQSSGLLLDVQEWVSPETYGKFYPSLHARASAGGMVWGIPDHVTARALYYNKDILDAVGVTPPATWKELISVCGAIRDNYREAYPWGLDVTTDEGYASFAYYIWNNGSDFMDENGNWTLDAPKNLEAVEFVAKMVNSRLTNPDPTVQTRYQCQDWFGQGKVAMMIAPSTLPAYCAANGNAVNYGIAPLPSKGENPSISTASGNFLLCFAEEGRTPEELAAITAVVDAFYADEAYAQWVQMEGFLPATTTANALLEAQNPEMAIWNQILGSLKFYPSHMEAWGDVKEGAVEAMQNTLWCGNTWLQLDKFQRWISER